MLFRSKASRAERAADGADPGGAPASKAPQQPSQSASRQPDAMPAERVLAGGADAAAPSRPNSQPQIPKQAVNAALSKLVSASIGDVVAVMSRTPTRKHFSLADIEWLVIPPVLAGQFYVAEAQQKESGHRAPVAVVTWAEVSAEVDRRLTAEAGQGPIRLRPDEWTSGDIWWLIDAIGDARGIEAAMQTLMAGPFKDREVKVAVEKPDGKVAISFLRNLLQPQTSSEGGRA